MRTVEAFREAEGLEPWRAYTIELSSGEWACVERQGSVTWDGPDSGPVRLRTDGDGNIATCEQPGPEYVRFKLGDGGFMMIVLDAVVALSSKPPRR